MCLEEILMFQEEILMFQEENLMFREKKLVQRVKKTGKNRGAIWEFKISRKLRYF